MQAAKITALIAPCTPPSHESRVTATIVGASSQTDRAKQHNHPERREDAATHVGFFDEFMGIGNDGSSAPPAGKPHPTAKPDSIVAI